jgi:uncharacterized protein
MKAAGIIAILRQNMQALRQRGVARLAIFGSAARGEMREDSDIDILVEFAIPVGLFEFVGLQRYLQGLVGRKVDLVTPDAIRLEMRDQIQKEAIYAA